MKITIELIEKTFFFLDNINISRADGVVEIDLSKQTDNVCAKIAAAVAVGIIKSNTQIQKIIHAIENAEVKAETLEQLGFTQPTQSLEINDEVVSKPEVIEVVTEVEVDEVAVEEVETVAEAEVEVVITDEELSALLQGANRSVTSQIRAAKLSDEDSARLLELETEGKDRATVKKVIGR